MKSIFQMLGNLEILSNVPNFNALQAIRLRRALTLEDIQRWPKRLVVHRLSENPILEDWLPACNSRNQEGQYFMPSCIEQCRCR